MKIKKANFIKSVTDYKQCPSPDLPEYAFIGRSNVGKSSLINMLTNHSNLARISAKPGKTQVINHFLINDEWYLVDLPGYGFAKVSRDLRKQWDKMIQEYLKNRMSIQSVFLLVDSRIEPQDSDLKMMEWMAVSGIPFVIVFTKADKISKNKIQTFIGTYKKQMKDTWEELPSYFITSSETGEGKDEILKFIHNLNVSFRQN
ncbi:MAG: ribosome biogenesis GTP-binding protein YihA/YsxC [Cytophagaceae bacterium]|nr:ribosome biogenesis GTP-binding protein YihA/YsxC [Cytophagaceae bacterium]